MSRAELLLLIALMAAVTLALRASFLVIRDRGPMPPFVRRALTYVPAAIMAAFVALALFGGSGSPAGPIDLRLIAGLIAGVVAWRTGNILATFASGMIALWTLTFLIGRV